MKSAKLEGVVTILVTPFDNQGHVDTESLRRLVEFNIEANVNGIGIAMGSEIFRLSEEERDLVTKVVVDQTNGRIPVVVNTGAHGTDLAIHYSQRAQTLGADALMILPPAGGAGNSTEIRSYFTAISNQVDIPIVVQDAGPGQVSPALIRQINEESEQAKYCKVETPPTTSRIAETIKLTEGKIGVFGGAGGGFFLEELERGSTGTMPGPSQPESFVRVWNQFQAGKHDHARKIFYDEILPVLRIVAVSGELGAFHQVQKHILKHLGIIDTAHVRHPTTPLDRATQRDLDKLIERLSGKNIR